MKLENLKYNKGVAGLTILISLVTFLFVIGLLIMIFSLMGGELKEADMLIASESETVAVATQDMNATLTLATCSARIEPEVTTLEARNVTGQGVIASGNYSISDCVVTVIGESYNNTAWNITYTMTYAGTGYDVINDTINGISTTTDWFDIFIVIGAMVVLILLTVIIIVAIRGSGLMTGTPTASNSGSRNVGSA